MGGMGRGQEGALASPVRLKLALPHTSLACPGSPPALERGTVTSWGWFFTRNLMTPQASWAALVMAPPISLVALPNLPAPISRSGISESSGLQMTREGRQTSLSPAHGNLSDPLPFLHCPSCPSPQPFQCSSSPTRQFPALTSGFPLFLGS